MFFLFYVLKETTDPSIITHVWRSM